MFFTIKTNTEFEKAAVFIKAKRSILFYRTGANEVALNNYLVKNYKLNLKLACLLLLNKATYHKKLGEVVITFKNKKDDELASIITYGTGKIQGSNILQLAFERI